MIGSVTKIKIVRFNVFLVLPVREEGKRTKRFCVEDF